ncbi:hypothetical protein [Streptomyces sp. NPDC006368]|uniref:hypothetical protein n=1 Tax=Streptomyces sp. NPDC006368 TaxID=3156760 RepID=UPI0033A015AA
MTQRFSAHVDVHLILRRTGGHAEEVLLSRRAGPVYASGLLHLPSEQGEMTWAPLAALPDDMVAYCRAGLDAHRQGAGVALRLQRPGDPIAYDRSADRLQPVPAAWGAGAPFDRP